MLARVGSTTGWKQSPARELFAARASRRMYSMFTRRPKGSTAAQRSLRRCGTLLREKPALRKICMVAYTGGAMRLGGWPYPVVVDLAGVRVTRKSRPSLKDHDRARIVGHADDIMVCRRRVRADRRFRCSTRIRRRNDFKWRQIPLGYQM
jgi:hypothetical protein